MGDFQLILMSEVNRPARKARESGALSLIPFPEDGRAGMGSSALREDQEIKPGDVADWFTPIEACRYAASCVGSKGAGNAIWQLLLAGMIQAVATSSSMTARGRAPVANNRPSIIPGRMWKHASDVGTDLWNGGYVRCWIAGADGGRAYQFFGIKFSPGDIRSNLPDLRMELVAETTLATQTAIAAVATAATDSPLPTANTANKGGRPRKEWWDDFWIEICRQIWMGDLQPKTQAELERAMFEWVENHRNAEVGETTVKAAAKKLFKAWGLGSKT